MSDKMGVNERALKEGETVQQRNMRLGWGCSCHGETFCPDLVCVGYENDVPVFVKRREMK